MIYKSKNKLNDIIENYDGFRFPIIKSISGGDYIEIEMPPKNSVKIASSNLEKQKIYHRKFNGDFSIGHYYVINGSMSYIGFEAGNVRKLSDKSFVKKLSENVFFADDWLIFRILLDLGSEGWKQISIKCIAENIECFSGQSIDDRIIFSKNTLDPGILEKEVPIIGAVRIDNIDKGKKVCHGTPLYLDVNYE